MNGFFAMGGYAAFVWPSYAATVAVLLGVVLLTLRQHRLAKDELSRLEREEGR